MNTEHEFERQRPRLVSFAYRMLGSRSEAEDILQEAFLRWQAAAPGQQVQNSQAFLTRMVSNLCIDRLRVLKKERELYIGPWLAEPLPVPLAAEGDEAGAAGDPFWLVARAEEVSIGLMLALEQLNPVERAVFLLRSAFDLPFEEISAVTGKTPDNCRQLYSRARRALDQEARPAPPKPEQLRVFEAFMQACQSGEMEALLNVLAQDVTLYSDGGGKARAAPVPIHSAAHVARFLLGVMQKAPPGYETRLGWINGEPGLIALAEGRSFAVLNISLHGPRIGRVFVQANPDKLANIQLPG